MTEWKYRNVRDLGWETYAWLLYSVPYLVSAFNSRLSVVETVAMLVGYGAFLVLYVAGQLVRGPRILPIVAGVNLIAVGFSSRNPSAASFYIYGAALLGGAFRRSSRRSPSRSRSWSVSRPRRQSACRHGSPG
jgi:hypothetical protein